MPTAATVLVVEDSDDVRRLYALALGIEGYRVIEARDGLEALLLLDIERPNLVVLDLDLPRISGYLVREELAARAVTQDIPIVVVTGTAADPAELAVPCLLRKPVTPGSLIAAIRKCLAVGARAVGQ